MTRRKLDELDDVPQVFTPDGRRIRGRTESERHVLARPAGYGRRARSWARWTRCRPPPSWTSATAQVRTVLADCDHIATTCHIAAAQTVCVL
jgi:hypothetical protein